MQVQSPTQTEASEMQQDVVEKSDLREGSYRKAPAVIGVAEKELIKKLTMMDRESALAKQKFTSGYGAYPTLYKGIQWPGKLPKHRVPAVLNLMQQLIERKAALMTDTRPKVKILPTIYPKAGDTDLIEHMENAAQALDGAVSGIWTERKLDLRMARAIITAEIFGNVGFNTCFNPKVGLRGDIDVKVMDPRSYQFDPYVYAAEDMDEGEYFITKEIYATDYLKAKYSWAKDKIVPDHGISGEDEAGPAGFKASLLAKLGFGNAESMYASIARTVLKDFWISDYECDEQGFPKWWGGKHIIVASNRIIDIESNPYIDGERPHDIMDWHMDVDSAWGFGDIYLYRNPQEMFNRLLANILENAALMSNSIWIGDDDALTPKNWKKLSNIPGSYVKKKRGRELKREAPPDMGSGPFKALQLVLGGLEKLSGISEAVEGRRPGQVTSGIALENLQVAAQTVIRLKGRHLETVQESIGQKLISRVYQYLTSDRMFSMIGDARQLTSFLFERNKIRNQYATSYRQFKYKVVPGSGLAMTKHQQSMMAIQLFSLGLIDEKNTLDTIEWPDRGEVLERMAKKQLEMLKMMQQNGVGTNLPSADSVNKPSMHPAARGGRGKVPVGKTASASGEVGKTLVPGARDIPKA